MPVSTWNIVLQMRFANRFLNCLRIWWFCRCFLHEPIHSCKWMHLVGIFLVGLRYVAANPSSKATRVHDHFHLLLVCWQGKQMSRGCILAFVCMSSVDLQLPQLFLAWLQSGVHFLFCYLWHFFQFPSMILILQYLSLSLLMYLVSGGSPAILDAVLNLC